MNQPRHIYMAGKISKNDWREKLIGMRQEPLYEQLYDSGRIEFPIKQISEGLIYRGPYFVGCDHGCFHGDSTHGAGAISELEDVLLSSHQTIKRPKFNCLGSNPTQLNIFHECMIAIRGSDTIFAWIDSRDCFGTIAEVGFAHAVHQLTKGISCKEIWIAYPEYDSEMWFVYQMATDTMMAGDPITALNAFLDKHTKIYVDYHEYLKSDSWRARALSAKAAAGWRCQVCNINGDNTSLHAHHRTYERLGRELPEDITVLCANCHHTFHKNGKVK